MKQSIKKVTGGSLLAGLIMGIVFFFSSCTKDDAGVSITYAISGNASSSQTVPASSNSNGSGTISGTYNSSTKVMSYTTTWSNLTGAPVSGGLYTGATGEAGSSIALWSLGTGLTATGNISVTTTLNAQQEANLLAGKCYYLLATSANASGEIRGQITATAQ